jgi:hypothetical protein
VHLAWRYLPLASHTAVALISTAFVSSSPSELRAAGVAGPISSTPTTLLISPGIPLAFLAESECGHPDTVKTEAVADERRPHRRAARAVNETEERVLACTYPVRAKFSPCPLRCRARKLQASSFDLVALSHIMPCKPWA